MFKNLCIFIFEDATPIYKTMKFRYTLFAFLILVMSFGLPSIVESQVDVINNLRAALKAGSSRDLVKLFNNQVEMSFDGEKSGYSKTQAEFVMRDFFQKISLH
jgi:hypothetical protein